MSVIILTTGVPGCGKTYIRCARFLVDDFLVNSKALHISNFPIKKDVISQHVSQKINRSRGIFGIFRKPVTPADIEKRLEVIPDYVLQTWRAGISGPWDYFQGRDLKYCHIAIDEIHNFVNSRCAPDYLKKWDDFLGEIRHRGCTFEGLTQDISQVDQILTGRASVRLELIPGEDLRDPFFKIKMADWYELKAAFLGSYHKTVFMYEKRKSDTRWKTNHVSRFIISPDYFCFYDSYSASLQEKAQGASDQQDRTPEYEYQRRSRLSLLCWFIRRNFFTLFFRILIAVFLFWLCFGGGLNFFIRHWLTLSNSSYKSNSPQSFPVSRSAAPLNSSSNSLSNSPVSRSAAPLNSSSNSSPNSNLTLEQQKFLDKKKEDFENGYKPGLFFKGDCWLRNGIRIQVNFIFSDPDRDQRFYKKKVVSIDSQDRCYSLDDGVTVYMY